MAVALLGEAQPTSRISQASIHKLPSIELSSIIGIINDPMDTYFFVKQGVME